MNMNDLQNINLENVLPHDRPMILIDNILEINMTEKFVKTSVKITENKIFFDKEINGISPLVGIEFMAPNYRLFFLF